ncbi:MAG: hypothetical protein WBV18_04705 [Methyloceanibacter sp.]|uniref:hypothetical protein n=1 Tax=Methyloceanibacter sp. TaxID=1965321 RepID=UPI003C5FEFC2
MMIEYALTESATNVPAIASLTAAVIALWLLHTRDKRTTEHKRYLDRLRQE